MKKHLEVWLIAIAFTAGTSLYALHKYFPWETKEQISSLMVFVGTRWHTSAFYFCVTVGAVQIARERKKSGIVWIAVGLAIEFLNHFIWALVYIA